MRALSFLGALLLVLTGTCTVLGNMPGTFQPVLAGGGLLPTLSFTASVTQTGGAGGVASGRSYAGLSIGTASPDRTIIIADGFRDAGNCPLASLTVGGISATRIAQQTNSVTATTIVSLWVATVPTGTTATIVTTYCASVDSAEGIGVYAAYNLNSRVPTQTAGSNATSSASLNVNVSPGGFVIAMAWGLGQTLPECTWTGVVRDYGMVTDPTSTSQIQDGASASGLGGSSPLTVSCAYGAVSTYEPAALAASFR